MVCSRQVRVRLFVHVFAFYALNLPDTGPPGSVYTHISIMSLSLSIIYLILGLVIAKTVAVYSVIAVTTLSCICIFIYALLLIGILKERPVLVLPAMVIVVCASEFCWVL